MKGNMFFIVGVQRSGTTMLSVMLSKHPDIEMEPNSIGFRLVTCFNNYYDLLPHNAQYDKREVLSWLIEKDDKGRLGKLLDYKNADQYNTVRDLVDGSIAKKLAQKGKLVWGDKSPNLQHFLGELMALIPNAKFLHIIRDGRATAYSMHKRSYKNLKLCAQEWVDGNIFGWVNEDVLGPDQYKVLKYEDLLNNPSKELESVCSFLEIPYSEKMLDLSNDHLNEKQQYVKSKIDRSKIDKWKNQLQHNQIQQIEMIQGPLLKQMGYKLFDQKNKKFKQLSLRRRMFYNQIDNVKQLFRSKQIGMRNQEKVVIRLSLKNRVYSFLTVLIRDFFTLKIFKSLFSRYFYTEKYMKK